MKKFTVILTILVTPLYLFSLNWTVEDINSYRVDKPTISVDNSGHAFIFGNSAGGNDIIGYIQNTSGIWQRDSLLFSRETSINYNCRVSSARSNNGTLHVLYRVAGGTYGWPVYSNNAGGTFTSADTLMKIASQSTFHYGIAVDNLDRAHIVCEMYYGSSRIMYFYPFADTAIQIADNAMDGTIAVDRNNVVHIAYCYPISDSTIYYTNNSSGSFSTPQIVSDSIGEDPSIAADSLGFAHITWTRSHWQMTSELFYATNETGVFQTTKITTTPNLCEAWPAIALSKDNTVGIVYSRYHPAPPYITDIFFAYKKAGESVFSIDSISPGHWNPSYGATTWNDKAIAIDAMGYVHLAYAGAAGTEYTKSLTLIGTMEMPLSGNGSNLELTCSPNPFRENLKIYCAPRTTHYAPGDAEQNMMHMTLAIYDITGRIIKSFLLPTSNFSLPISIIWDGTAQDGQQLPRGIYLLRASAEYDGKRYSETEKVILTD